MDEEWRPVVGYEGWYEVSNCGSVRGVDRWVIGARNEQTLIKGRLLTLTLYGAKEKYYRARLSRNAEERIFAVHRLVAEAFIGKIPPKMVVHHIDENKLNNCVSNLAIITYSANILINRSLHDIKPRRKSRYRIIDLETGISREFDTAKDAGEHVGVNGAIIQLHADGVFSGVTKRRYRVEEIA